MAYGVAKTAYQYRSLVTNNNWRRPGVGLAVVSTLYVPCCVIAIVDVAILTTMMVVVM